MVYGFAGFAWPAAYIISAGAKLANRYVVIVVSPVHFGTSAYQKKAI